MDTRITKIDDQGLKPDSVDLVEAFREFGRMSGGKRDATAKATGEAVEREDEAYTASRM